jgi:hypothetical protein
MKQNYPSVAKRCTFEAGSDRRCSFLHANKKRINSRLLPCCHGFLVEAYGIAASFVPIMLVPAGNVAPEVLPLPRRRSILGDLCMTAVRGDAERRMWPRLPLAIPVFVRSHDGKGNEFLEFATALNVSAGGMLLAVRRVLPLTKLIRLEIPSAPVAALALLPRVARHLQARALRNTPAEGYYLLGLKFSRPLLRPAASNGTSRRKVSSVV